MKKEKEVKRIVRDRLLTKEEAEKDEQVRQQVEKESDDLIQGHLQRGCGGMADAPP
tara:strand:+ start:1037 stop:1204 length:168 start_codon:yes stop_codon:yes gene_type:complete